MALQIGHWHVPLRPGCASGGCWALLAVAQRDYRPGRGTYPGCCFQRYLAWDVATICRRELCPAAAVPFMIGGASSCRFLFCSPSSSPSTASRSHCCHCRHCRPGSLGPIIGRFHLRCAPVRVRLIFWNHGGSWDFATCGFSRRGWLWSGGRTRIEVGYHTSEQGS
jgi:hypothetical protein